MCWPAIVCIHCLSNSQFIHHLQNMIFYFFFFSFVFVSLYGRCLHFVYEEVLLSYGLQLETKRGALKPRRATSDAEPSALGCSILASSVLGSFLYFVSLIKWSSFAVLMTNNKKTWQPPSKLILSLAFFVQHSPPKNRNKPAWRTQQNLYDVFVFVQIHFMVLSAVAQNAHEKKQEEMLIVRNHIFRADRICSRPGAGREMVKVHFWPLLIVLCVCTEFFMTSLYCAEIWRRAKKKLLSLSVSWCRFAPRRTAWSRSASKVPNHPKMYLMLRK